jgi:hypothetical protein
LAFVPVDAQPSVRVTAAVAGGWEDSSTLTLFSSGRSSPSGEEDEEELVSVAGFFLFPCRQSQHVH